MPAEDVDLTGTTFGGFEVLELIGRGGMGLVYRARQVNLDRAVALKILAPALAANKKFIARFVREARAAGRLGHPNIVQGIDVGEIDGRYFFAMELVRGRTLLEQLRATGPIDEALAIHVLRKVADALEHAGRHGIVHRDIKPDNILMSEDGEPKLADLGLAKVEQRADDGDDSGVPASGVMTSGGSQGVVLGTPAYISPEQALGRKTVDTRSDLYSLGMSVYHLLAGTLPFAATTKVEMLAMHFEEPMPDVRGAAPKTSDGMARLLMKLGEKDPDDRPQTPQEVLEALDAIEAGEPMPWETQEGIAKRRRQLQRRRRSKAVSQGGVALGAVAVLLVVAFVAWPEDDLKNGRRPRRPRPEPDRVERPSPSPAAAPAPAPEPVKPPAETPFQQALREALETADAFARDHPDDLPGTIERYRAAIGPENPQSSRAAKVRIADLERRLAAAAKASVAKVRDAIEQDIGAGRFAAAWAAFAKLPDEVRDSPAGSVLRTKLNTGASEAFDAIRADVDVAQRDSDWPRARRALTPVLRWGVPEVVAEAERMVRAVKQLEAGYEAMKAESHELGDAFGVVGRVPPLLAARDVAAARAVFTSAKRTYVTDRAASLVADEAVAVQDVEALLAAVDGAGDVARGTPFSIGRVHGEITTVERGQVGLKLKRGSIKQELAKFDAALYLEFAKILLTKGATAPAGVKGDPWAGWVILAAASGDVDGARAVTDRDGPDAHGFDSDTGLRLQMRLETAAKLAKEIEAAGVLAQAEAAVTANNAAKAAELLSRFEAEFRDTEMMLGARLRRRDVQRGVERLEAKGGREPGDRGDGELPGGG